MRRKQKKKWDGLSYLTNPHLICLEKTETHLLFSRFGNILSYNSLDPDLTLKTLKLFKISRTLSQAFEGVGGGEQGRIQKELLRLIEMNLIYSFETEATGKRFSKSPILNHFIKDHNALPALSRVLDETRLGIVDFGDVSNDLTSALKAAGFNDIKKMRLKDGGLGSKDLTTADFFIVIGDVSHRIFYSKLNQTFRASKKRWMLVTLDAYGGIMGPTFGISGGPCYDCIVDHSKRHYEHQYQNSDFVDLIEKRGNPVMDFSDRLMAKPIFSYVAVEVVKVLSKLAPPMTFDGFFTFDLFNFKMEYNIVYPSPVCPICSELS
jgi:bacteriocin biosynthesis cyclodehydratase domain-containing protein